LCCCLVCIFLASAAADADPPPSVLHLANGGLVAGQLRGSNNPKIVRWSSPLFAEPLEFRLSAVKAVDYRGAGPQPQPPGEYCLELGDDDLLYGDLLGLTETEIELESARLGRVHVRREDIRRLYRAKGANSIYFGPNGLSGWKDLSPQPQWHEEAGQLYTDQYGASICADLGIPDKAVIEVELSWRRKPDFILAFGVNPKAVSPRNAFHFDVWDNEIVVIAESARDADLASVAHVGPGEGHIRVQAYLDQTERLLILLSRSGKPLASLKVGGKKPSIFPGVLLTNRNGDVRLEHLRISGWNGVPPRDVREDQSRVHRSDGSVIYGRLAAYDPEAKEFTIREGTTETRLKHDEIAEVFLSPSLFVGKASSAAAGSKERILRVAYRDGSRFSGTPTRIDGGRLTLACPGVREPLSLTLAEVRSLIVLRHDGDPPASPIAGRPGRLEMEGTHLQGRLVDASRPSETGCLVWQPDLAVNASPLIHGAAGRIVYRELSPPKREVTQERRAVPANEGLGVAVAGVIRNLKSTSATQPDPGGRRSLHLRSGDTIPCDVTAINEKGVFFRTPLSDSTFVAHEKVKSVELVPTREAPQLDETKRDRLLTLPRMQKGSPPTHLICSKDGDFLRGRLLEMDDKKLKVELRAETREIPRDRIAQIIWLHADELTGQNAPPTTGESPKANRVQILNHDGNRLTFVVEKADHSAVSGKSDVLGACRADLAGIDQLLFGTYIEESASKLAYNLWKLHHATEPKFVKADRDAASEGRLAGTESPLVGQPAILFKLDMLDGSEFSLGDHKGRVVVLDFWASWCGPCMQTMPLVEAVVRESGGTVELFAINMEEQSDQVKASMERHKLKVPVVLDRDGAVAAKYSVTAIPQTVVIDRDGKVARLYVGGGKKTADSLRKALEELTAVKASPRSSP
jgi:thiol-disulfide isomerase/thioredoxin